MDWFYVLVTVCATVYAAILVFRFAGARRQIVPAVRAREERISRLCQEIDQEVRRLDGASARCTRVRLELTDLRVETARLNSRIQAERLRGRALALSLTRQRLARRETNAVGTVR